jgi:hypothetical protein
VSNNTAQVTTGATSTITVNVTTEPAGSLGIYRLYVSQAGGAVGTATLQTEFVGTTVHPDHHPDRRAGAVNPVPPTPRRTRWATTGSSPSSPTRRRPATSTGRTPCSTPNPGDEFQAAFLSLYQSVKADPD